tara:strand:+ start:742 stop:948 length:207 start_codon:yes stop_codon:yes gene_type:complete
MRERVDINSYGVKSGLTHVDWDLGFYTSRVLDDARELGAENKINGGQVVARIYDLGINQDFDLCVTAL